MLFSLVAVGGKDPPDSRAGSRVRPCPTPNPNRPVPPPLHRPRRPQARPPPPCAPNANHQGPVPPPPPPSPPSLSGRVPLGLASLTGMAVTGYILVWKYSSAAPTFCGSAACADVLRGPYSELFGVSIAVPAFAAYSLLLLLTLALPALQPRPDAPGSAPEAQPPSTLPAEAIVTLSTAMACSSAYLVSLLSFGLRELCPLCLTSAASAVVACAAAWTEGGAAEGVPVPARRRAVRVAVAAALVFSSVHFYVGSNAAARYQPAVVCVPPGVVFCGIRVLWSMGHGTASGGLPVRGGGGHGYEEALPPLILVLLSSLHGS